MILIGSEKLVTNVLLCLLSLHRTKPHCSHCRVHLLPEFGFSLFIFSRFLSTGSTIVCCPQLYCALSQLTRKPQVFCNVHIAPFPVKKKTSFFFTFDVLSGVISWKQSRQISFPAWVAPKETNIFAPGVWAPLVLMGWSHWHWDWMARDVLDVTSRDEKGCRAPDKLNLLVSVYLTKIYMSAFEANITHSLLQWYDRTMPFWKHDWLAEGNPTIACIKWKDVFRPSLSATNCPASRILLFLKL